MQDVTGCRYLVVSCSQRHLVGYFKRYRKLDWMGFWTDPVGLLCSNFKLGLKIATNNYSLVMFVLNSLRYSLHIPVFDKHVLGIL